jgi:hypothetical protein
MFLPTSQLKAKKCASPGSSSVVDCVCKPLPRIRMRPSRTADINGLPRKSQVRQKQTSDMTDYGHTAQELADLAPRSVCIYYTRNRRKTLASMEIPLIGSRGLKIRRPKHMFLSVQQCPIFVPMNTFFQHWALLGYLWDQEPNINPGMHLLKESSKKYGTSAESDRVYDAITPAPLDGLEVPTRPEHYESLSRAGKRRVRAAQLKQKDRKVQGSAAKAPDHRNVISKRLKDWRKKKFKQGQDVYNTCHTCWQIFSCGHQCNTLCRECDVSWNSGKTIKCPLWAMRANGTWKPHSFLLFLPEPCGICPSVENTDSRESTKARYHRFLKVWVTWRNSSHDRLTVRDVMVREGEFLREPYRKEEADKEWERYNEEERFWIDDPAFEFRDFRRRL